MSPGAFNTSRVGSIDENVKTFLDVPHGTEIPVKKRKQTDFICFFILVLFFIFLVVSVSIAGVEGDIRRFFFGYDDRGNICGYENEPIEDISGSGLNLTEAKFLQTTYGCDGNICWIMRECVNSCENNKSIMMRCQPELESRRLEKLHSFLDMISSEVSVCWIEMIVLCFFSICISGFVLTILRMFPLVIIFIIFVIVSIITICGTILSWAMVISEGVECGISEGSYKSMKHTQMLIWLAFALAFTIFTVVFFAMLYTIRKKSRLISALFVEGGKSIKDMPLLLLQPILTYLMTGVFLGFMFIGLACFLTTGKAEILNDETVFFPVTTFYKVTSWLLFFGFLWLSQFFLDCQNLVIAGAVSAWYFTRIKGKISHPICKSFSMVVKHHLGSAAFGSLFIAIIRAIRFLTKMFENNARENRHVLLFIFASIVKCLLVCVETFLKILNKSAYVMIVLFGEPFCSSARKAFTCITKDTSRVGFIIGVGTFILTVVELLITCCVTFVGISIFKKIDAVSNFWIPTCIVFILSYLCCHCFFSVYDMTIDTLILCFCVDHQMNNGLETPFYMNRSIMVFLNDDDRNASETSDTRYGNQNNVQAIA